MTITIQSGDVVYQHPRDRHTYVLEGLADHQLQGKVRLRPAGDAAELFTEGAAGTGGIIVADGINGATYMLTMKSGIRFEVRITSKGIQKTYQDGVDDKGNPIGKVEIKPEHAMDRDVVLVEHGNTVARHPLKRR